MKERKKLPVSQNPEGYKTGDIITWMINSELPHMCIISHFKSEDGKQPMIVYNIGHGQVLKDRLFKYPIVRHFTYEK